MSTVETAPRAEVPSPAEALAQRLTQLMGDTLELFTSYLGDRLGLYRQLATDSLTPRELAARTNTHERYVQEWLEQQAVAGILMLNNPEDPPMERRYTLPPGHAEALADRESPYYVGSVAQATVSVVRPIDAVLDAFRTGAGVPFEVYGHDCVEGMARMNRVAYLNLLGTEHLPAIADVHARLQADPPARVADIGCGAAWSSIAVARAYPQVTIDAFEIDPPSVAMARANIDEAGLADRISIQQRDVRVDPGGSSYDVVIAVNCIHDMGDPVAMLRAMREMAGEQGVVIDAEPGVGEHFTGEADALEAFIYAASVLHCLPVGLAEQPSVATGMAMRPGTLRRYVQEAGFQDIEHLPIDDPTGLAFYRLVT